MKKTIITSLLLLSWPLVSVAATVHIVQAPQEVGVGDTVSMVVSVDTAASVNTFSGDLFYSKDVLEFVGANDGDSIINLWLARPSNKVGVIHFEGLIPGGYSGDGGIIFTVFLKAKTAGVATVSLENAVFLRNDGIGAKERVSSKALSLNIVEQAHGGFVESADTDPPEPFSIQLGKSPDIFNGRPYIVFTTTDKGSGISGYEVAEQRVPFTALQWHRAESPYALVDQYRTSDVYVKAIDNVGNALVSAYPRQHALRLYEWSILGMITLLIALYFYVKRKI